jgi:hypothetical protein
MRPNSQACRRTIKAETFEASKSSKSGKKGEKSQKEEIWTVGSKKGHVVRDHELREKSLWENHEEEVDI